MPEAGRSALVTTAPIASRHLAVFSTLGSRGRNFRPRTFEEAETDPAWHVDHRRGRLGRERPGPPVTDGPWETARRALADYAFADPSIVRAAFDGAVPLDGRDMLLVAPFLGLRFPMGVRVGGVVDREEQCDGRPVHRFAWHYSTLEGHLERGQMQYELLKWADSGDVEIRLHAYSQRSQAPHPVIRLGMRLFGRWMQHRFYDRVVACLQELTA